MSEPDFTQFDRLQKGRAFEDFHPGQRMVHHWGRSLTEGDNAIFSTATCNWNPMYLNAEFARAHGHDGVVINPMLVLCTVVGLSVEDLSESGGPFLSVDDCEFLQPVYPGDTVTATSTVLEARLSESRPGSGIVTWETLAHNQREELVLSLRRTNLVRRQGERVA